MRIAEERAEAYARGGEWGDQGASVDVEWVLTVDDEDESEVSSGSVTVDIEPDHEALIREAVADACGPYASDIEDEVLACEHEWEGVGGCDGVRGLGGTALSITERCDRCGLVRVQRLTGSQRNPGEHDTVRYTYEEPERVRRMGD